MTSILTNTAAMSSLRALSVTQGQVSRTQAQVSSGLKIASASDNAAYWSIGQAMSARISSLASVNQALSLTTSIAGVTAAALTSIKGFLDRIQNDIVAAGQAGIDAAALQADISAQQKSILAVANAASFNGVNWLTNEISADQSTIVVAEVSVSAADYAKIALGEEHDVSSDFDSTVMQTFHRSVNGVGATETVTSGLRLTRTDAHDGTMTQTLANKPTAVSGSTDVLGSDRVVLPTGISAGGGLLTTSFPLDRLTLFSDLKGGSTVQQTVNYHGTTPSSMTYGPTTTTTAAHSYDGDGGAASTGILDPIVYIATETSGAPTNGAASTQPTSSASQKQFNFDFDGGSVDDAQQGAPSPGSGAGQTEHAVPESILTLDITGTSAADRAVIGQAVQTAIARIIEASTAVGAVQTMVSTQAAFNSSFSDALTSGLGSLVDADMGVASARLQALQTQQQLGMQALSIANQDTRLILRLFGQT